MLCQAAAQLVEAELEADDNTRMREARRPPLRPPRRPAAITRPLTLFDTHTHTPGALAGRARSGLVGLIPARPPQQIVSVV